MIKRNIKEDFDKNVFNEFLNNWALITAGGKEGFNPMTVSWGGLGILWNKPVATLYVRDSRKTLEYLKSHQKLTLSFFGGDFKEELTKAGGCSGHDVPNKFEACGLTPIYNVDADVYYAKEAKYVLKLTTLYMGHISESEILDKGIVNAFYKDGDYHTIIIASIDQLLTNEE